RVHPREMLDWIVSLVQAEVERAQVAESLLLRQRTPQPPTASPRVGRAAEHRRAVGAHLPHGRRARVRGRGGVLLVQVERGIERVFVDDGDARLVARRVVPWALGGWGSSEVVEVDTVGPGGVNVRQLLEYVWKRRAGLRGHA